MVLSASPGSIPLSPDPTLVSSVPVSPVSLLAPDTWSAAILVAQSPEPELPEGIKVHPPFLPRAELPGAPMPVCSLLALVPVPCLNLLVPTTAPRQCLYVSMPAPRLSLWFPMPPHRLLVLMPGFYQCVNAPMPAHHLSIQVLTHSRLPGSCSLTSSEPLDSNASTPPEA